MRYAPKPKIYESTPRAVFRAPSQLTGVVYALSCCEPNPRPCIIKPSLQTACNIALSSKLQARNKEYSSLTQTPIDISPPTASTAILSAGNAKAIAERISAPVTKKLGNADCNPSFSSAISRLFDLFFIDLLAYKSFIEQVVRDFHEVCVWQTK
jgi:hypothetical protein